jgi:2-succinyl-6-hydroxy-2,4-cyclohexadiene-1-carboxylate synthase
MHLHQKITGSGRGPVVLFLHGFIGSHRDWDSLIEGMNSSYCCVAVDLPGHGQSKDNAEPYSMDVTATAIIDLVDSLGAASFSIIGYSMGGRLALYLASIYAMRIDALVIESAAPGLKTDAERAERRAQDERWARLLEVEGMRPFLDAWYRQPLFASLASRPELLENLVAGRSGNDPRELARALRGMGVANQRPLWDEWRANRIPTLVVAGERDPKYCAIGREMADICVSAKAVVVPGAGHNVHGEAPDDYNAAVRAFFDTTLLLPT